MVSSGGHEHELAADAKTPRTPKFEEGDEASHDIDAF
jgi:hypothetical protein